MGEGDFMPTGGHQRRYDPKRAQKIREGGKIADKVRKTANQHHREQEVPAAEAQLLKELEKLDE
jgi:hypothetical protein